MFYKAKKAKKAEASEGSARTTPIYRQIEELAKSDDFVADLRRLADCLDREKSAGLEIGEIAHRWIGDAKYSRILNPARFSEQLKQQTGRDRSPRQIRDDVAAYRLHTLCVERAVPTDNLSASHLAQVASSQCKDENEELELAHRANEQQASVRQIRHLAQRLHREREEARRTIDVVPTDPRVERIDGLDLITAQNDKSIDCLIMDWQWGAVTWGSHADFPQVHCPNDPVEHLCSCLEAAGPKLADDGLVFLFHTTVGLLDRRIEDAWKKAGLRHSGQLIWQKRCGGIFDNETPLAVAHEHVHLLCHKDAVPKAVCGYAPSVTPKWAAPTNAHSGKQHEAIHPHQKPIQLMEYLISIAAVNGLIVDPFAGSGSAGVAAVRRGCSYLGAELSEQYVEIANRRIALAKGENGEVVEAINFFHKSASPEQRAIISQSVSKCNLQLVHRAEKGVAA